MSTPPVEDPSPTRTAPLGATVTVPGAAQTGSGSEAAGDFIGRYRLLEELGEGGFGVVWRAEQTEPIHREVALKVIKAGMDSREIIARFEAERQALALMDHPNIAGVLDAGTTENGRPFFAMELVKGSPITAYCDARKLNIRERLELFIPVCQAVQHAHQKAILHRDLKPSNILVMEVDGKPVPKVIDFGIAKALGQAGEAALEVTLLRTQAGMVIGTPQYMSPEQAWANGDMDTRSDVYTLGVILYELLTGGTPLPREVVRKAVFLEVVRMIREIDPVRPSSRVVPVTEVVRQTATSRSTVPARLTRSLRGDLDWICLRALEKERERRYGSAADLAQDLQRHLRNEPVEAGPPSSLYRLRKLVRRNRLAFSAAAVILLLLVAGIGVSTWQAVRALRAERKADEERDIAQAVNEFLQNDLLAQASSFSQAKDQTLKLNPNLTVREALDRASQRIESRFRDRPLVEAALHAVIGETYGSLEDPTKAFSHHQRALQIRTRVLGFNHPDTLDSRIQIAEELGVQGQSTKATEELRAIHRVLLATLGPDHEQTLGVRARIVQALHFEGKLMEAEKEARAVLADMKQFLGTENVFTMALGYSLTSILMDLKRPADAEILLREFLARDERIKSPEHPDSLTCRSNLATCLGEMGKGKHTEAEAEFRAVLATSDRVMGKKHPHTLNIRNNLAILLGRIGQHAEAESEHRAIHGIRDEVLGPEHPSTLKSRGNWARELAWLGRHVEAERELRAVLEVELRVLGQFHPNTFSTRKQLCEFLQLQGKFAEAVKERLACLAGDRNVFGEEHPITLQSWSSYAYSLILAGEHSVGLGEYDNLLPIRIRVLGEEHPDVLRSRSRRIEAFLAMKRYAEAEKEYRDIIAIQQRSPGSEHPDTLSTRNLFAEFLRSIGRFAEAEQEHREVLAAREQVLGPEHLDTAGSRNLMAEAIRAQGRFAESEVENGKALAVFLRELGEKSQEVQFCRREIEEARQAREKVAVAGKPLPAGGGNVPAGPGEPTPDALQARVLQAERLRTAGKFVEAEKEHREVLVLRERVLGPEHLDTARSRNLMAEAIRSQNRFAESVIENNKVLAVLLRELGEDHVETQFCRRELSEALEAQGKWAELEEQRRAILSVRQRLLGAEHKDTLWSAHQLALCLEKQGKADEALPFAKLALAGYEKGGAEKPESKRARELVERLKAAGGKAEP